MSRTGAHSNLVACHPPPLCARLPRWAELFARSPPLDFIIGLWVVGCGGGAKFCQGLPPMSRGRRGSPLLRRLCPHLQHLPQHLRRRGSLLPPRSPHLPILINLALLGVHRCLIHLTRSPLEMTVGWGRGHLPLGDGFNIAVTRWVRALSLTCRVAISDSSAPSDVDILPRV